MLHQWLLELGRLQKWLLRYKGMLHQMCLPNGLRMLREGLP